MVGGFKFDSAHPAATATIASRAATISPAEVGSAAVTMSVSTEAPAATASTAPRP